jgi:hypothetical protein
MEMELAAEMSLWWPGSKGEQGRTARLKVGDIEIEARTTKEVIELSQNAVTSQCKQETKPGDANDEA